MEHVFETAAVDARIARLAERQHGVVSIEQLLATGLGHGAIKYRMRCGRLHRLYRGVYAVGHRRLSREGRWLAAVLALGPGAALSHSSAAALRDLRRSDAAQIHVTVPSGAGRLKRRGIVVHRSRTLRADDVQTIDGIPVTTVARTLLDLAGRLADGPLERVVERAQTLRWFDARAVSTVIERAPTRPGATKLARVIARIADEPVLTRSQLEIRMRDLLDAHDLERPAVNAFVDGREVDFLWRRLRLIVETDGHETHGTRSAFERDRARDARLTMLGYRVVRFTYRQVVYEPDGVAATLRGLIAGVAA